MNRTLLRLLIFIVVVGGSGAVGILIYKDITDRSKSEHRLSVEKIERLGKLELVRISVKDVLEQTKKRLPYLPNAKALLIVVGEVSAGIDLEKVKKEDFLDSETQVTIKLPKPEILMSKINHEKSKIYDVTWGLWWKDQLVDEAYKDAEKAIIDVAEGSGYEETCKKNAVALLTPLFGELAGKKIVIEFKD
jgi:hypothetical protein